MQFEIASAGWTDHWSSTIQRQLNRWIVLLLLLGFYYNVYRYPFRINSSMTSPTYGDTPVWLSLGKYFLVVLLLVGIVLLRLGVRREIRVSNPLYLVGYAYLMLLPILAGVMVGKLEFVQVGFFFLIPLVLHSFAGARIPERLVNRVLALTIYLALLVEAVQVALFAFFGRLPALAYSDSLSVRFGSFLDDPNGFGLLVSWMVPFALVYFGGARRVVIVLLLFLSLILTQSLTALGAFLVMVTLYLLVRVASQPRLLFRVLVAVSVTGLVLGTLAYVYREQIQLLYTLFMLTKEGSVADHAASLTVFGDMELRNLLGLQPLATRWEESGYVNLLANFGVGYLATFLIVGAAALLRYLAVMRDPWASRDARAFASGAFGLLVAVYFGNLTLPIVDLFPLNLFAALFLGLATAGLAGRERRSEAAVPIGAPVPAARMPHASVAR